MTEAALEGRWFGLQFRFLELMAEVRTGRRLNHEELRFLEENFPLAYRFLPKTARPPRMPAGALGMGAGGYAGGRLLHRREKTA